MHQAMRGDEANDHKDNDERQTNLEPDAVVER
jgi:hypothetical protein